MTTTDKPADTAPATPARSAYTHCIQCGKKLPSAESGKKGKAGTAAEDHRFMRSTSIDIIDTVATGGPRFCTLRCAAGYGVDTARAWERRGISLKHPAQREAEAAGSKNLPAALAHAAAATGPTAEDPQP